MWCYFYSQICSLFCIEFFRSISLGEMHKYLSFFILHWQGCFFLFFWQARFLYSYARLSSSQSILRDPIISNEAEEPVLTPTWLILISECKYTLHNSMCCLGLKGNWILNPKPTRPLLSIEHFIGALFLLIHYISSVSNSTELKIENMYDMKTWNLFTST